MIRLSACIAATMVALLPVAGFAATWVALGNSPINGELDSSSVRKQGSISLASIRMGGVKQDGITYFMHQDLAVFCGKSQIEVLAGRISSDRSAKVVEMPPLPENEKIFRLPTPNPGFSRLYDYVCQR